MLLATTFLVVLFSGAAASAGTEFTLVHYNIKELDSTKLRQGLQNPQLAQAVAVLKKLKPDLLSINEMQYDLPGVPNASFTSTGQNMMALTTLMGWKPLGISFDPANTGLLARPQADGTYPTDTTDPQFEPYSDPINYGIFPAEYATAGASRFPIVRKLVFQDLKWAKFRPDRKVEGFLDAFGEPLKRETTELFDKNFTDAVLNIQGKEVHFILFHTVPSFDFGKEGSPNIERNGDQLAFLEWYLTGKTEFEVPADLGIEPLAQGALFVAVGDWNTDVVRNPSNPGSRVIQRLFKSTRPWLAPETLAFSYESQPFTVKPYQNQFDYLLMSKQINVVKSGIYAPVAERKELGCGIEKPKQASDPKTRTIVSYRGAAGATCFSEVTRAYAQVKQASDHRPIWARLRLPD